MHYTGMAAFEIQGRILWDPALVAASIALGALFGAAALPIGLHPGGARWKIAGALLLTLAICSHHFTAMGAASIIPDPTIALSAMALPSGLLAIAVALATLIIIMLTLAGAALEVRDHQRGELEAARMRGLANAAVEGLVVCDGETIVTVNDSFAVLVGASAHGLMGAALERCIPEPGTRRQLLERADHAVESELLHADGSRLPVELIMRAIDFGGKSHRAIAVRDLRARKQAEQHIRFLAHHDVLTGLPNRSAFNKRLDQEIEASLSSGLRLAVLCLDLDRFKEINDLFGHATGDKMLQVFANRVTSLLDGNQMMARLSGDEFAIIVPGLSDPAVVGGIAENILDDLRAATTGAETDALLSTSIGIAICPDDASDRNTLLTHATRRSTGQERRPRHLSILRSRDGRGRTRPSPAGTRPAPRDPARRVAAGLSTAEGHPDRRRRRLRGVAALDPSYARRGHAGHVHPARGRDRPDLSNRRMGAPHRVPRSCGLAAAIDGGNQRVGTPDPCRVVRRHPARCPARDQASARPPGARNHRNCPHPRSVARALNAATDQGFGRSHRDGRFRHRLFLAVQPAGVPVRQDQDRQLVYQVGQCQ